MKKLTLFPMASYKNKIIGLVITAASVVFALVVSIYGALPLIQADANNQFNLFLAVASFGLYLIAWSKEKNDDERVQQVRAKAMQVGFGTLISGLLAFIFCTQVLLIKTHEQITIGGSELMIFADFGLAAYLITFYIGLLFDPSWIYNNDTVVVNIKKNKQFFVVYVLAIVVLFILIFLFRKH